MDYKVVTKILSMEDVKRNVLDYEEKHKMKLEEYLEKHVKGNEEELDKQGKLEEVEDWIYYDKVIKSGKLPKIEQSTITQVT